MEIIVQGLETHIYYCVPSTFCIQNDDQLFPTFISLILQSILSCITYHFVVKQLIHLIWHAIPYWINSMTSYITTKGKICGFRIFHREEKCCNVFSDTTSYSTVYMYKWIFSWLALSGSTREERLKTVNVLGIFMAYTRQQWISNQDSYLLELL